MQREGVGDEECAALMIIISEREPTRLTLVVFFLIPGAVWVLEQ